MGDQGARLPMRERLGLAVRAAAGVFSGQASDGTLVRILNALGQRSQPPRRGTADFLRFVNESPLLRMVLYRIAEAEAAVCWRLTIPRRGERGAAASRVFPYLRTMEHQGRRKELTRLKAAGEVVQVEVHPFLDLLQRNNSFINGLSLRKLTFLHTELTGEFFWLWERNGAGMPTEALPIPPSWVANVPTPGSPYFELRFSGLQAAIPAEDVLWGRDPDPANPYGRGIGSARALADELETDEYAAKHTKAFFWNDATPRLIVMGPNVKPGDQLASMEQKLLTNSQGYRKAWRPMFMSAPENTVVKELQVGFQNMQMVELRDREKRFVREYYGIPPEILGDVVNSNRSTIDNADVIMGRYVLVPRLELMRLTLQESVIPMYDDRLLLEYDSPIPEDREFQLKAMQARPQTVRVDEWRVVQGFDPLGADAGGDAFIHSAADVVVDALEPEPAEEPDTPPAADDAADADKSGAWRPM